MCSLKTNPVFLQSNYIIMPTPTIIMFRILGTSQFSRSSRHFWRGLEDPRSDKIYSSGNRGVKKGPGPRGTRDEEFLVPSLLQIQRSRKTLKNLKKKIENILAKIPKLALVLFPLDRQNTKY